MIVAFLAPTTPRSYYEFGRSRAPMVGEYVHAPGGDALDGLPAGTYRVDRVTWELGSGDEPTRVVCLVEPVS